MFKCLSLLSAGAPCLHTRPPDPMEEVIEADSFRTQVAIVLSGLLRMHVALALESPMEHGILKSTSPGKLVTTASTTRPPARCA
jgi:hypothetical protein